MYTSQIFICGLMIWWESFRPTILSFWKMKEKVRSSYFLALKFTSDLVSSSLLLKEGAIKSLGWIPKGWISKIINYPPPYQTYVISVLKFIVYKKYFIGSFKTFIFEIYSALIIDVFTFLSCSSISPIKKMEFLFLIASSHQFLFHLFFSCYFILSC